MTVKVLLVEDNSSTARYLETLLRFEGYDAQIASPDSSLDQTLELVLQVMPAAMLLDVNLRKFNGFELLARIRQEPALRDLSVLIVSGTDLRERSREMGADFLLKPYMPDELFARLKSSTGKETHLSRQPKE